MVLGDYATEAIQSTSNRGKIQNKNVNNTNGSRKFRDKQQQPSVKTSSKRTLYVVGDSHARDMTSI